MSFSLPDLSYATDSLEPHIDSRTMGIHHGKHHATYIANLNNVLESSADLAGKSLEDLLANNCAAVPENGGGHADHSLFWTIMGPGKGGDPVGNLAQAIDGSLGGFEQFKEKFAAAGIGLFGSGWAWLIKNSSGEAEAQPC